MPEKSQYVEITALWFAKDKTGEFRRDKNGNLFLTGKLGNADLILFQNMKSADNQPDYRLLVKKPYRPESGKKIDQYSDKSSSKLYPNSQSHLEESDIPW